MNSYKITYVVGEGETEQTYITERTEAAARKFFKKASDGREIVDVELYDTEASATKDQERETLEKIKAMPVYTERAPFGRRWMCSTT